MRQADCVLSRCKADKKVDPKNLLPFVDLVIFNCWVMYSCCTENGVQRKDKAMIKYDDGRIEPNFLRPGSGSSPSP